jgi:deoxycytidylate deaminase
MDAGNKVRELTKCAEIMALWAIADINGRRSDGRNAKHAYVLRSVKHPDEARALRAAYGPGFFLIGLYASEDERRRHLVEDKGLKEHEAADVIERDRGEDEKLGQQTRDTFELADVFIRQEQDCNKTKKQLARFLGLVFGSPFTTPTPDEQAMFLAYAASLRSGDLSRQVGAVAWRDGIGVLSTGCNDVPTAGGGLYWTGDGDRRDHAEGFDANEKYKREIATDVANRVIKELNADTITGQADLSSRIETACLDSRLIDITEFGRAVHAEMDAILSCGRSGASTAGCTLYCTTLPCHNCAKHLVAAGFQRVVYIEPYAKSQARELHGDALKIDEDGQWPLEEPPKKVLFQPFVGVAPRRYFDLFSMRLSAGYAMKRKVAGGAKVEWTKNTALARVPMLPTSYIEREEQLSKVVGRLLEGLKK